MYEHLSHNKAIREQIENITMLQKLGTILTRRNI